MFRMRFTDRCLVPACTTAGAENVQLDIAQTSWIRCTADRLADLEGCDSLSMCNTYHAGSDPDLCAQSDTRIWLSEYVPVPIYAHYHHRPILYLQTGISRMCATGNSVPCRRREYHLLQKNVLILAVSAFMLVSCRQAVRRPPGFLDTCDPSGCRRVRVIYYYCSRSSLGGDPRLIAGRSRPGSAGCDWL